MAYSIHDLKLTGISVENILSCRVEGKIGEHSSLFLSAYIENGDTVAYEIPFCQPLELYAGKEAIFFGVVSHARVCHLSELSVLELEGKSYSWMMDMEKRSRSFQNPQMSYRELAEIVLQDYPGSKMIFSAQDAPIGSLILQYEETDWGFLKRVMSRIGAALTPESRCEGIALYAGIPELGVKEIPCRIRQMEKDMETYYYLKANKRQVRTIDFTRYMVSAREPLGIFEQIEAGGTSLTVYGFQYIFEGQEMEGTYGLQLTGGLVKAETFPMQIIGVALMGTVTAVSGDRVQAALEIDGNSGREPVFWFPYSTMSASPNGSGWYCMPEVGDDVRIYFPSKYEREAVALSAVSNYETPGGGEDRMVDPASRYLRTKSGQELLLTPGYMRLSSSGGMASLTIQSDGSVSLAAAKAVHMIAEEKITLQAKGKMILHAQEQVSLQGMEGGSVSLGDGKAVLRGTTVNLD